MMGCRISRIGGDGAPFPTTRLRPLLLQQLAEMRTWRLPHRLPAKDTPSKKGLLSFDDKQNPSTNDDTNVAMATVIGNSYSIKVSTNPNLIRVNSRKNHDARESPIVQPNATKLHADHEDGGEDEDDDDDQEGRSIGAGPASPSFRIFFEDAAAVDSHVDQNGQNEAEKETDSPCDVALSKQEEMRMSSVQKKEKRERKTKRHIKSVAWGGKRREAAGHMHAVKNLLKVKGCYHPHRSTSLPVAEKPSLIRP